MTIDSLGHQGHDMNRYLEKIVMNLNDGITFRRLYHENYKQDLSVSTVQK